MMVPDAMITEVIRVAAIGIAGCYAGFNIAAIGAAILCHFREYKIPYTFTKSPATDRYWPGKAPNDDWRPRGVWASHVWFWYYVEMLIAFVVCFVAIFYAIGSIILLPL